MSITVRHPAPNDRRAYLKALDASRELHGQWLQFDITDAGFDAYLERSRRQDQLSYLVCDGGVLAGFVNANNIVRGAFQSCFLGYGAFSGRERRGVMTEGLSLVVDDLFHKHELHRVEANIQPGNQPSRSLVQRVGFVQEGFSERYLFVDGDWRDHERWALTSENWSNRPSA